MTMLAQQIVRSDFIDISTQIYPNYLQLNKANTNSTENCPFLDLDISVTNNKFKIKVYNKTDDYSFPVISFPFLESNIATTVCYSVYSGEVLNYLRICSSLEDFIVRVRKFSSTLLVRGYSRVRLSGQLFKVLVKHLELTHIFGHSIKVSNLIETVFEAASVRILCFRYLLHWLHLTGSP